MSGIVVTEDVERLVKSTERVRDLGEVFTPAATVEDMLDMLPVGMWAVHPSPTFLEPSCGDGNFLIAILTRKLDAVAEAYGRGTLPAGTTPKRHDAHGNHGSCNCEQRVSHGQTYEPERAAQPLTKRRAGSDFTWSALHQSKGRNCDLASKLSEAQVCGSAQRLTRTVSEPYIG